MRVHFTALGCRLNQAEIDRLARGFLAAGHLISPTLAAADLHVVNSCTVTHRAARDSRKLARRGRRLNPRLRTVLTGCYVASSPEEAARLVGVDLVVPNHEKDRLIDAVHRSFPDTRPPGREPASGRPAPEPTGPLARSRALVKVEDGCDMRCSFCVIPLTRGRQRSRPPGEVRAEARRLAAAGHLELVVTGVQISSYRLRGLRLYELIADLLEATPRARLRLSSIAPWELDPRLFALMRRGRLCRHLHLSLQSGSAATLRRMRRPGSPERFAEVVAAARREVPGLAVTTDVIVGFPGESADDFETSLRFVERARFARIHVFPFSPRPGTEAASLPGQIPAALKRRRLQRMLAIGRDAERAFAESRLGTVAEALWEASDEAGCRGITDNFIRVHRPGGPSPHRLEPVRLEAVTTDGVRCSPLSMSA